MLSTFADEVACTQTAIMCATDIISSYRDDLVPLLNVGGAEKPATSLLAQLLLKGSSNDKRFVIEEAKTALKSVADNISPRRFAAPYPPSDST